MSGFVFSFWEGEVGLLYCTIFLFIRDEIWFYSWCFDMCNFMYPKRYSGWLTPGIMIYGVYTEKTASQQNLNFLKTIPHLT